jgi:predicted transcriptional regulator
MSKVSLNINIDKDLRDELKIIAVKHNTTLTEIITNLIEEYIDKNK